MSRYLKRYAVLLLGVCALFLVACSEEAITEPRVPELMADTWNEFSPGGETTCADGSQYKYYAYPGTENKLVVDFQGGGACWNDGTCSLPIDEPNDFGVYNSRVFGEPTPLGIYDKTNPDNPVGDWYHAYIPYCTADIHIGNSTQTYTNTTSGEEITVQHKGQVNAQAVLNWVFEEFEAPETIFVTGCSAGAYGSIAYTPQIQERYPDAEVYQMGDCGAGVTPEAFFEGEDGVSRWNTESVLTELIPELDLSGGLNATFLTNIYETVGETYPESVVSQYNSAFDGIQIYFYALQQGASFQPSPEELERATREWTAGLDASLGAIAEGTDNFYFYTSLLDNDDSLENGTTHCIIGRPEFYEYPDNGDGSISTPFVSWVDDLVNGRTDELENVSPNAPEAASLN